MKLSYTDMVAMFGIGGAHPGGLGITKQWIKKVNPKPHQKILDIGCGTGQSLLYLAENTSSQIIGIDQNVVMLEKASQRLKNHPRVDIIQADAEELPFSSLSIDCIISESVTAFTKIKLALKEYHRVLKDNGMLTLLEMTSNRQLTPAVQDEIKQFYGVTALLTKEGWIDMLKETGFHSIEVEQIPDSLEAVIDFDLNQSIDPAYFDLMANHYNLTEKYKDDLSARLYYCRK
ncbi:methyltransferase domain-containing protein [Paraliobacillus sediminis]|uniref:methyltransferase domain-containing protein n=1 Tax=Paraliobacillus sediminis TaxID=1885916 RepID=UPI000E3DB22B|nr:methyltransferase domain-containing protein [Paraliobacillus sediminis]